MMKQRQRVFVDTGAFYAIKDLDDAHHREAVDFVTNFTDQFTRLPRAQPPLPL